MSATRTTTKQPQQLCALTIGFNTYLMPPEAGMKVMQLMQKAVECERDLGHHRSPDWLYIIRGTPRLEMCIVKASQVRQAPGEDGTSPGKPLLIGGPAR